MISLVYLVVPERMECSKNQKNKGKTKTKNIPRNPLILSEWHAEVEGEVWDVLNPVRADSVYLRKVDHVLK